jgi:hypothetical protein
MTTPDSAAIGRPGGPIGPYQIHTEAHGPHWIAWITREGATKPDRSVVLVAASREEADARAKRWAEESTR